MASKKSFNSRASYKFPSTSRESDLNEESERLELDEGEVWNSTNTVSITESKKGSRSSSSRVNPVSLPINIPDNKKRNDINKYDDDDDEDGTRIPPHEYLARTRGASHSVHEGIGRTLKGRDLSSVRNAIWKKMGFED